MKNYILSNCLRKQRVRKVQLKMKHDKDEIKNVLENNEPPPA